MGHYFFSDRLIYTKGVTIFKNDSDVPQIMPKNEWFNVDIITCAAPYIAKRKYTNKTALKELFKDRIKNIFEAAIDNDVEVIILGAFGCGAFKNPTEVVAKAFHEMIEENNYGNYFKKIVFAIPKGNNFYRFDDEFFGEYHTALLETPLLPLIESLNKKCKEDSQFLFDYDAWKWKNKYYGKQFSILGDSISTLAGYNPKDYKVFYADENCEKSGVKEMQDTWWGKVIDFFGGELLVNNSWSGSRITRLPDNENLFPSGCSDERTGKLHINNVKPDVVMVYLGTNDWAFGADKFCVDNILGDDFHCISFDFAYSQLLSKIEKNYPNAEIWCCTLNTTFMSSNPSFNFPYKYGGTHIEEYNQIIKDTADINNCKIIDLYSYHIPYDSIDGSHPNADGMNTLATLMIREIEGEEVNRFLDCDNEHHQFSF
ncbi:MAG: TIGR02452 family protein [Eubacterium sp.]|nr:TIGR02452 family protein [Eubacterium sp.]